MRRTVDNSSSDGNMSEYEIVSDPDSTPPSSPRGSAALAQISSTTPKGWSTLILSDNGGGAGGSRSASHRRGFSPSSSSTGAGAASGKNDTATSGQAPTGHGPFSCKACRSLLRDCVECPSCHSLFCREHLRIDQASLTSPCPCDPCCVAQPTSDNKGKAAMASVAKRHPCEAFLSNIPVQRMADAVPSRCDACGTSMSWGELGVHTCDLQVISCEHARWGCGWVGRRHQLDDHITSSTCRGQLARAEHDVVEARAETASVRSELAAAREATEAAERRATAAENRVVELEEKLAAAEKQLLLKTESPSPLTSARAAASAAIRKATTVQPPATPVGIKRKQKVPAEARSGGGGGGGSGGGVNGSAVSAGETSVQTRLQTSSGERSHAPPTTGESTTSTTQQFAALLTRAGFPSSSGPQHTLAGERTAPLPPQSGAGRTASATAAPVESEPVTAVQESAAPSTRAARVRTQVVEAACQAPVPATEACLRPYLERPDSLIEKKVVVFWPRQGKWYVGRPTVYKQATKEHRVEYDDGDVRDHVLAHRSWGLIG